MLDKLPCRYSKNFSGSAVEGKGFWAVGYTGTIEKLSRAYNLERWAARILSEKYIHSAHLIETGLTNFVAINQPGALITFRST
jgi:hypothetical protein